MGKKRSLKCDESKEMDLEEVSTARNRFKNALHDVVKGDDTAYISSDEVDNDEIAFDQPAILQIDGLKLPMSAKRRSKRREVRGKRVAYEHTFVMKLYDRSVDLAEFDENTPLYPICRAWLQNKPKVSQTSVVKTRIPTPERFSETDEEEDEGGEGDEDIIELMEPSQGPINRIPSPIPEQLEKNIDKFNFNINDDGVITKELMEKNMKRWSTVKNKWLKVAKQNEERYIEWYREFNHLYKNTA